MTAPLMVDGVLYATTALSATLTDVRFVAETPATLTGPLIVVTRTGGPSDEVGLDLPDYAFDCYQPTTPGAVTLATRLRLALHNLRGTVAAGGVCTQVRGVRGPFTAPYINTNFRRQVVTAALAIVAVP